MEYLAGMASGLLVNLIFAYVSGKIAVKKGYSRLGFEIFGIFFGAIALITASLISDKNAKPQVSGTDELLKYKQLLDNGIITEEEFLRKKISILKHVQNGDINM